MIKNGKGEQEVSNLEDKIRAERLEGIVNLLKS